ncbi:aromatic ring-hydroxylating oxygenase subunit alpha [Balneatrix alpica]|uniref:Aromatic ring-hydroxylating dioxygenase subunit alpha n=1 Tax=Balneatrix alpica TaxID=75684 RepID=A0ABV5ZIN7_9GAMM|nr:aromatic ring-hydroxylating dioxygenase subunit alpha [Balneatrix alpica]
MTTSALQQLNAYREVTALAAENARALPFASCHSKDLYQLEMQRIFRQDWIFMLAERELPEAGDYFACELAGEALVLIRGADGQLRALSNLCCHRGTLLLDPGFGRVSKHLVCPYHAWTYGLDGGLKGIPLEGKSHIDHQEHCLTQFLLGSWQGLVFVHLGKPSETLAQRFSGLEPFVEAFELTQMSQVGPSQVESWQANWKLIMENAMESYHLFKVHKDTLEQVTPTKQAYYVAGQSSWSLTSGEMKSGVTQSLLSLFQTAMPEHCQHYLLLSLPPNFVAILTCEGLGWIQVLPQAVDQSLIRSGFVTYADSGRESKSEQSFTQQFFAEDKWICERLQQGMKSQLAQGGRLVEMERVVADFHHYLGSQLFAHPATPVNYGDKAAWWLGQETT